MTYKDVIRIIPDFPEAGVRFKDLTTVLRNGSLFRRAVDQLAAPYAGAGIDLVAGPEARGFAWGSPVAYVLGAGFVPIRKPGRLPAAVERQTYQLEYREDALEIHRDAVEPGQRVLIVDDLLATGGTALASAELIRRLGGIVAGFAFFVELEYLEGRKRLAGYRVESVVAYS